MNRINRYRRILCVAIMFSLAENVLPQNPILWPVTSLSELRPSDTQYKSVVSKANQYLSKPCPLITDKTKTFSGNIHNYESLSTYFWPNEASPESSWVVRDGQKNPERLNYDGDKINVFSYRSKYFAQAYFLTRLPDYAQAFAKDVNSWFINKQTLVNPNFDYAQIIPNRNANRGNYYGIIDAYVMIDVIEGLLLMHQQGVLPNKDNRKIKRWFKDFGTWLRESEQGIKQSTAANNLSLAYDVMMYEIYYYTGQKKLAKEIVDNFYNRRLRAQILPDGSQPQELKRAKPMAYSLYNLEHVVDFCVMQQSLGNDYYVVHRQLIDAALKYINDILANPEGLTSTEVSDKNTLMTKCDNLKQRIERLTH